MSNHPQLKKLVDLKSLTRNQARMEIAKDVLAGLEIGALRPAHTYLRMDGTGTLAAGESIRDALASKKISVCQVCALGAVFTATIARVNDCVFDGKFVDVETMCAKLSPYFGCGELLAIEYVYERYNLSALPESNRLPNLLRFVEGYVPNYTEQQLPCDDQEILIAIMLFIIDNNGELS